jgi:hypothetical protein
MEYEMIPGSNTWGRHETFLVLPEHKGGNTGKEKGKINEHIPGNCFVVDWSGPSSPMMAHTDHVAGMFFIEAHYQDQHNN